MFQKDWLARQLEALATLSAQILLLRQKGDNKTAQAFIDAAYGEMFGLDPRLVGLLPTDFLIDKVRTGDRIDGHRALFDLIESSPAPQAFIAEGVSFYEWLLEQDDADLIAGNLPRDEVDESLARLLAMQSQTAD